GVSLWVLGGVVSRDDGVMGGPKVRSNERIDRRLAPRRAWPLSRHQKERSRVSGRAVSLPRAPMLAVQGQVMKQLFRRREQVVEAVNFRRGVEQPSTLTHDRVKTVVMVGVQRKEQRDDRVPAVSRDSTHEIAAHFA